MTDPQLLGRAYGRTAPHPNLLLTQVGPGTPCGDLFRRYWQPVGASKDVTTRPQKVRILGEDLILFRDGSGRAGLLYPRCMHRGTSLYYGKVTEAGIRCCYHGWQFDVTGQCLDQPCEPDNRYCQEVRQPWYPVLEQYGIVFAYMGPPEKQPLLPRYDIFENLEENEFIQVDATGFVGFSDTHPDPNVPYNWLQNFENLLDPAHIYVLHGAFTRFHYSKGYEALPKGDFGHVDGGVTYTRYLHPEGATWHEITHLVFPNVATLPNVDLNSLKGVQNVKALGRGSLIGWHVPVDDAQFRIIVGMKTRQPVEFSGFKQYNGKSWNDASEQERQDFPGDYEAQFGQGPVTFHSEEHLATTDRGVVMFRRLLTQQIQIVQQGGDPMGVNFDPEKTLIHVRAGLFRK
jgi:phenylpropionate dioxygenase-like ring-hydroxylating dioxygenase large terminal subunit